MNRVYRIEQNRLEQNRIDKQTNKQIYRQIGRQADRQTNKQIDNYDLNVFKWISTMQPTSHTST